MQKLRIGIVLDRLAIDADTASFYGWATGQEQLELVAVFLPQASAPGGSAGHVRGQPAEAAGVAGKLGFKAILWSERRLLSLLVKRKESLASMGVDEADHAPDMQHRALMFDMVEGLTLDTLREAQALAVDLLVNVGTVVLPPSLLAVSRLGAVRIDYRQDRLTPDAPVGFWEAYSGLPKTRFTINRADRDSQDEDIVLDGSFRTQFSYLLNQALLCRKALAQLQRIVLAIADTGKAPPSRKRPAHGGARLGAPDVQESLIYLNRLVLRLSAKALRRALNIKQRWAIQVMQGGWRSAGLLEPTRIAAPPGRFWADPFVRSHRGRTYCFVEDYLYAAGRAHISVLEIEGDKVTDLGVAVKEDFHLSFPFLFEYEGEIYMCPEASQSKQIRVYRSTDFPFGWELCSIVMDGISAADTMIFEHGGRWWLLTSIDRAGLNDHCSELCLFHASSPLAEQWIPHPANPVYVDAEAGRNAGLIIEEGKIFRAAQIQGFDLYGEGLSIYEIVALDEREYREVKLSDFRQARPSNALGSHHISTTGKVTVTDFLTHRFSP